MRPILMFVFFVATLAAETKSSVHTLYDTDVIQVHSVTSSKAKDSIIDLTKIAIDASLIHNFEKADLEAELKLQKYWTLVLMNVNFEMQREVDLQSNKIDMEYNDQEVNLLYK